MSPLHPTAPRTRTLWRVSLLAVLCACDARPARSPAGSLSVLLITADDMNWDSPGFMGGAVPGTTPNLDRLAAEGAVFEHAYVSTALCQPSRSALMTGRYPHRNGALGFEPIDADVPTLPQVFASAGYLTGILSKSRHLAPAESFPWDVDVPDRELGKGRSPELFAAASADFFALARERSRPFFLMVNTSDPHRPFPGSPVEVAAGRPRSPEPDPYGPADVAVPASLPDLPEIRADLARYYTAVRRGDRTIGAVLDALARAGLAETTLVLFLSDNGRDFPFAKGNVYRDSNRTPLVVRWPGAVAAGRRVGDRMIAAVDLMPTLLAACGLPAPAGMDGRSFAELLTGDGPGGRQFVFTQIDYLLGEPAPFAMRAVQDTRYGYVFNAWSDGTRRYSGATTRSDTFAAMVRAARSDPDLARRIAFYLERVPEELYDYRADPHALRNLIGDPAHAAVVERMRRELREHMARSGDPARPPPRR